MLCCNYSRGQVPGRQVDRWGGPEDLSRKGVRIMALKSKIISSVAAVVMMGGVAAPALATVVYPEGGTWSYGTRYSGTQVYSNYHHPSTAHRGSTINWQGDYSCTSASAGNWAYNSQRAKAGAIDRSYYATRRCGS